MSASQIAVPSRPQNREKEKKDHTQSQNPEYKEVQQNHQNIQPNLIQESQQHIISSRSNPASRNVHYDSESQQQDSVLPNISAGWNLSGERGQFSLRNDNSNIQPNGNENLFMAQRMKLREKIQKSQWIGGHRTAHGNNLRFNLPSRMQHARRIQYIFGGNRDEPRQPNHQSHHQNTYGVYSGDEMSFDGAPGEF